MALALLPLLAFLALTNAAALSKNRPRIVNGEDVNLGEIPYQVSLQYTTDSFHFCGGSILSNKYVLTAAHCVEGKGPHAIKVVAGTVDLYDPQSEYAVEEIIMHKNYNPRDSWLHDIALIKVEGSFVGSQYISFVTLPTASDVVNAEDVAVVSGWGRIWSGGPTTNILQKAVIYIADHDYCQTKYGNRGYDVYDSHICAHNPQVEMGACNGDSGGPLTVNGKIVGIVSWSLGCALTNYPTVYTRVSTYLDWIQEHAV